MSAALIRSVATPTLHKTVQSVRAMRKVLDPSVSVGFVPTMGALHEGHLSLVRQARTDNDVVVASIFVNPTQFAPGEDLDKYPRQLEEDSHLLAELGVDHVFAPDVNSMYGKNHASYVEPVGFDDIAEGQSRPGHFRGVATVVTKLLNIVQPTAAYFGQKDAAQCVLIRRVVEDLDMDVNVIVKDTIRESDGLAMSSRNAYLTATERQAATIVYRALCAARDHMLLLVQQHHFKSKSSSSSMDMDVDENHHPTSSSSSSSSSIPANTLRQVVTDTLLQEPLVSEIEYVSVSCKASMRELQQVDPRTGAIVSLACKVGSVRLIDNIVL